MLLVDIEDLLSGFLHCQHVVWLADISHWQPVEAALALMLHLKMPRHRCGTAAMNDGYAAWPDLYRCSVTGALLSPGGCVAVD
jgi:hypothetical protein